MRQGTVKHKTVFLGKSDEFHLIFQFNSRGVYLSRFFGVLYLSSGSCPALCPGMRQLPGLDTLAEPQQHIPSQHRNARIP